MLRIGIAQARRAAKEQRWPGLWGALILGWLALGLLAGCRSPRPSGALPEATSDLTFTATAVLKPVPSFTPTLRPVPTFTPTLRPVPTFAPTLALAATFTPTLSPTVTPTFKPKAVMSPTLIPLTVLSASNEDPPPQVPQDPVPTDVGGIREVDPAEAAPPPANTGSHRIFAGDYTNLTENQEGQVRLQVRGSTVYATLQTARSPVQYFAREQPTVLFTVPEGFRPAVPISWEVNGQHVRTEGQSDPNRRDLQVFRLQVDTDGQVRYVDDAAVDGVGHLRYHTTLAWPLAGTDPQVCRHPPYLQESIVEALPSTGPGVDRLWCLECTGKLRNIHLYSWRRRTHVPTAPACMGVSWEDLATINALGYGEGYGFGPGGQVAVSNSRELAGLTQLERLSVQFSEGESHLSETLAHSPGLRELNLAYGNQGLSGYFLAPVSQLRKLVLKDSARVISASFLEHVPHLTHLSIQNLGIVQLPVDFLSHTPDLLHLDLHVASLQSIPPGFLAHVPKLTHLKLASNQITELPADFLAFTPQLEHLTLALPEWTQIPAGFLSDVTQLQEFSLDGPKSGELPGDLLDYTSQMRWFVLSSEEVRSLPPGLLASMPRLEVLKLLTPGLWEVHADFLSHAPSLKTIQVGFELLGGLPERFLSQLPTLTHLTLDTGQAWNIPVDILATLPQITRLELDLDQTYLLGEILEYAPQLQHVSIKAGLQANFPIVFLDQLAHLTDLHLDLRAGPGLEELPQGFLANVPALKNLSLEAHELTTLPANFLENAPLLEVLTLKTHNLQSLPAEFLSYAPQLQTVSLTTSNLNGLPENFLSHTPQLTELTIHDMSVGRVGTDALPRPGPSYEIWRYDSYLEAIRFKGNSFAELPERFLALTPSLRKLELWLHNVKVLPSGFLSDAPHLETLHLIAPSLQKLPEGFLARSNRLEDLVINADSLTSLPFSFLSNHPQMDELYLKTHSVESLPRSLLCQSLQLREFIVTAHSLQVLPGDCLDRTPQLTTFYLSSPQLSHLPAGFLSQAPNLSRFFLFAGKLEVLPENLLGLSPRLTVVDLGLGTVEELPEEFLSQARHLKVLFLFAKSLKKLPPDFLHLTPKLHTWTFYAPSLESLSEHLWSLLWDHGTDFVVTDSHVNVRTKPSTQQGEVKTQLQTGMVILVQDRFTNAEGDKWLLIGPYSRSEAYGGWIHGDYVAPGLPPAIMERFLGNSTQAH